MFSSSGLEQGDPAVPITLQKAPLCSTLPNNTNNLLINILFTHYLILLRHIFKTHFAYYDTFYHVHNY